MRYLESSLLLCTFLCSCASVLETGDRTEKMLIPPETRSDTWGFDPEKEIPHFLDVNEWIPIPKVHPWMFTIKRDTGEDSLELTIGYIRQYVNRYSNVEGVSYHAFFSPEPSLLAWRIISKNAQDGWLALEGTDGKWHRSRWGTQMEVQLPIDASTSRVQTLSVSIETSEGSVSRTFNNNGAIP